MRPSGPIVVDEPDGRLYPKKNHKHECAWAWPVCDQQVKTR